MAVILSEEEKQQQQPAQVAPGAQAIGAGPAAPKKSQGSGLFTNLNRYIDANKGNEAVTSAVNEIGGKADAAQNQFNTAQTGFNNIQAPGDHLKANKAGVDSWLSDAEAKKAQYYSEWEPWQNSTDELGKGQAYSVYNANLAGLKNQADQQREQVGGWDYNDAPARNNLNNSFTGVSNAIGEADKAQGIVGNADVRAQHLKEKYNAGRGDYSSGQGRLDNFLVNNAGRDTFNAKKEALKGIVDQKASINDRRNSLNTSIDQRAATTEADKLKYFNRLNQFTNW